MHTPSGSSLKLVIIQLGGVFSTLQEGRALSVSAPRTHSDELKTSQNDFIMKQDAGMKINMGYKFGDFQKDGWKSPN